MYNLKPRGIEVPNAIVSLALVYGGLTQWVAGIFEFVCGNTFGYVSVQPFQSDVSRTNRLLFPLRDTVLWHS